MAAETLYDKLGGEKGISAVVHEFYDRMIADEKVRHYFTYTDLEKLREHQITYFMSYALGGPHKYQGNTLRIAHKGLNISFEAYEIAIRHMNGALRKYNVPIDDRVTVEAFLRAVKPHIINK
ncbi:group 1 truncated hemoglobin GlbN [Marinithermofilum abyssi]|uniref:Group 1 truncated hemoglobin n=1 Tax=Marinithermofilum abyssi TaxID=1571185 RepID=A0A8J2Y916_9BACL|nr:group 1 truncated hemoglobin [Marinithermofilum abyssi]GGE12995.1 group 1 truncated hemoglobin GlbN [Marinithermofilum abyssi]